MDGCRNAHKKPAANRLTQNQSTTTMNQLINPCGLAWQVPRGRDGLEQPLARLDLRVKVNPAIGKKRATLGHSFVGWMDGWMDRGVGWVDWLID